MREMKEWKDGVEDGLLKEEGDLELSDEEEEVQVKVTRGSVRSTVWMILATIATINGRRVLGGGFPYPFYFMLLLQIGAYVTVALIVLLVRLRNFRAPRRKEADEKYTWLETIFIGFRIVVSSSIAGVAILCGAQALLNFPNLPVLAMLPIMTYVFDSILFRFAHSLCLFPRGQDISFRRIYKVSFVLLGIAAALFDDYRLNLRALLVSLAASFFFSLSKVFAKIGPRIEQKGTRTWESPLKLYLLAALPPLILAAVATTKFENYVAASITARSWTVLYRVMNLGPGVLLHIIFNSALNAAYPFTSEEHVGGALEETSEEAKDAVATTLQTGFWIFIIGVFRSEYNLITWPQAIAFTLIYIITVGPKHIGYYPPRALNLILRLTRRRSLPIHPEPWQFSFFLLTTTAIFGVLLSINAMFWVDTVAHGQDMKTWLGPSNLFLDTTYRPPQLRSFDVIIAHQPGDPEASIAELISWFGEHWKISGLSPKITIYTKDAAFNMTSANAEYLRGSFVGDLGIQSLRNTGGVSASYLHHILYAWEFLPVQSIFLTTNSTPSSLHHLLSTRIDNYFVPPDFPIPDAAPKTGFLNLGEQEVCYCGNCFDSLGWEDSFHLVPSMWSAARPGAKTCESVVLTYGNNFIASAARIKGLKREVYQLLYDALMNEDIGNAWAHAREKLPIMKNGEEGRGRWAEGEVYGVPDSKERPYLGFTVERLWGVLLQCSNGGLAWRCPNLEMGWRRGGGKEDCGCVE